MTEKTLLFAVCCLLFFIGANTEWLNCTPPGQSVISCSVSNNSDDCVGTDKISTPDPLLPKPVNFSAVVFRATKSGPLGVKLSWNSPNSNALSFTEGYVLRLFARDTLQSSPELCRYFKVNKTESYVSVADANLVTFTFEIKSLQKEDITYQAELYTLPYSNREVGSAAYVSFRSTSTTTAAPLIYDKEVMNLQIDNSKPYTLSGTFRMSSHFPTLRDIYKHVAYRVILINSTVTAVANGIPGNEKTYVRIQATEEEYASFTLEGLLPGQYPLEVRPFVEKCDELLGCLEQPNLDEVEEESVTVKGADYKPNPPPKLHVSPSNDASVTFQIAPSYYYIEEYTVTLRKAGIPRGHSFSNRVISPASAPSNGDSSDEWMTHIFKLNASDVLNHFRAGDVIEAEVTPKLNPAICEVKGYCNLNGTCTPCSRSISLDETIFDLNDDKMWIVGIVVGVTVVLVVALVVMFIWARRNESNQGVLHPFTKCVKKPPPPAHPLPGHQPLPAHDGGSVVDIIPNKVSVCLAYAQHEQYKEYYECFRSVLEHHFNCSVSVYNGSPETRSALENSDCKIVLYSWPLVETYVFLESRPQTIPTDQKYRQAVLDVLLKPQPNSSSSPLYLVSFDTVPCRNINQLINGNSDITLLKVPTEFKQLIESVHGVTGKTDPSLNQYWEFFSDGPLKGRLDEAVNDVTRFDSGFDSLSIATVQTGNISYMNIDPTHKGDAHDRFNTIQTTTAKAPEQQYLRQESMEYPVNSALRPTPAIYEEVSEPAIANQPTHQMSNRANGLQGTNSSWPVASAPEYQRLSSECESVASSRMEDDSLKFSDWRSSILPGSLGPGEEPSSTIHC